MTILYFVYSVHVPTFINISWKWNKTKSTAAQRNVESIYIYKWIVWYLVSKSTDFYKIRLCFNTFECFFFLRTIFLFCSFSSFYIAVLHVITFYRHHRRTKKKNRSSTNNGSKQQQKKRESFTLIGLERKNDVLFLFFSLTVSMLSFQEVLQHHIYTIAMLELAECKCTTNFFLSSFCILFAWSRLDMYIHFSGYTFFVN